MLKKLTLVIALAAIMIFASSCGLFKCKHKKYDVNTVAPTCTSDGYTEHTCKKCGESYRDSQISKLAHTYSSELVASDCFKEGYTKYTCTACGDSYTDIPTAKTTHYFVGEACPNCGIAEITENITPDTEWYNASLAVFDLTTPEQLAGLASLVNSGTDFSGVKIYLDTDIDLGFYEWIPIGNATYAFNGTFDGDGHTVSGLKINAGTDYVGLFGNVSGKICNFKIEKANIYVKRDHNYVSIACGYSIGEIKDISTDGFIEALKSNYVGGVAGATAPTSTEYTNLTNKANINAQGYVGGIIGQIKASGNFQTNYINNTGSVKGVNLVGGIFGHVNGAVGSTVSGASVSADVVGEWYVGGVVGRAENVTISACTNDGSTITANSYHTVDSNFYAWLGGIVGYGCSVSNCTNNVNITYNAKGIYVGGIAGYAVGDITDCTNNGDMTTNTSCVGGIVGEINSGAERNLSNLTNTGNISGNSNVGGIFGSLYQVNDTIATEEYEKTQKNSTSASSLKSYHHAYRYTTVLSGLNNSGTITGSEDNVGGIFGKIYVNSSGYKSGRHCVYNTSFSGSEYMCTHTSNFRIVANNFVNTGNVEGGNAYELFGSFESDAPSTITNYTVTGKVTVNGEVKEGTYDVGSNTNLTLSGREIYTEATE